MVWSTSRAYGCAAGEHMVAPWQCICTMLDTVSAVTAVYQHVVQGVPISACQAVQWENMQSNEMQRVQAVASGDIA
jgi:hypothetical protein